MPKSQICAAASWRLLTELRRRLPAASVVSVFEAHRSPGNLDYIMRIAGEPGTFVRAPVTPQPFTEEMLSAVDPTTVVERQAKIHGLALATRAHPTTPSVLAMRVLAYLVATGALWGCTEPVALRCAFRAGDGHAFDDSVADWVADWPVIGRVAQGSIVSLHRWWRLSWPKPLLFDLVNGVVFQSPDNPRATSLVDLHERSGREITAVVGEMLRLSGRR